MHFKTLGQEVSGLDTGGRSFYGARAFGAIGDQKGEFQGLMTHG